MRGSAKKCCRKIAHIFAAGALAAFLLGCPPASLFDQIQTDVTKTVANPVFAPQAGEYTESKQVTIGCDTPQAIIRYTKDGTEPLTSSTAVVYSAAILVDQTLTIKAAATCEGWQSSGVVTGEFVISSRTATPTFYPQAGVYPETQMVDIACADLNTKIRWTNDGSTPSRSYGALYTTPVTVSNTQTIRAVAYDQSLPAARDSVVAEAAYTIVGTIANPEATPGGGPYHNNTSVVLNCATPGATIRYTTDGTTVPTRSVGTIYDTPIAVNQSMTVKAIAYNATWPGTTDSAVVSLTYALTTAGPTATTAGQYLGSVSVSLACATTGAVIQYTTNGDVPSLTVGTTYSTPFTVSTSQTVKAYAYRADWNSSTDSIVVPFAYEIKVHPPGYTLGAGTYTGTQSVSFTCATAGFAIRYTTDGSDPKVSGTALDWDGVTALSISQNTTVRAYAKKTGCTDSDTSPATYAIRVIAPAMSPSAGGYTGNQAITLSSGTSGATIRYRTDGTDPTSATGTVGASLTIYTSTTVKAIAYKIGMTDSLVTTAPYTLSFTGGTPDGTLDPVNHDGMASTGTGNANAVIVDPDGKIVVCGAGSKVAIARFLTDGSPDTSWGTTGVKENSAVGLAGQCIARQPDGKYVVGTFWGTGFVVVRFTAAGIPDPTFKYGYGGADGVSYLFGGAYMGTCYAIALQSDGKIVIAGTVRSISTDPLLFTVARLNDDGSPDTTFSGDGMYSFMPAGTTAAWIKDIAIQSDGKILLVGVGSDGTGFCSVVARLTAGGVLDTSFDTDGVAIYSNLLYLAGADCCALLSNGSILIGGQVGTHAGVIRLTSSGAVDTAFGTSGVAQYTFSSDTGSVKAIAVQSDGKIVIGVSMTAGYSPFYCPWALGRFTSAGLADTSFDGDGMLTHALSVTGGNIYDIALQGDGKIVAAGPSGDNTFTIARWWP